LRMVEIGRGKSVVERKERRGWIRMDPLPSFLFILQRMWLTWQRLTLEFWLTGSVAVR
jgi:hypothetical protein